MLVHSDDLDTSPPDWLVDGLIPRVGAGFAWGKSRWGKSLLVNGELGLAVANGTEFFGRKAVHGSVAVALGEGLYDAGVRKQARLARQQKDNIAYAARIAVKHGDDAAKAWLDEQPDYNGDNLYFMTEPFVLPVDHGGEPTRTLRTAISSLSQIPDLELVILDAFSDFSGGLSISNDASANRSMLGMKTLVRELECCVLAVAHPLQNGTRMLGAGRLFNAADFVIQIEPDETTAPGMPQSATVICEKNKYGSPFDPFGYVIEQCAWHEPVRDDDGELTGSRALVTSATVRPRGDEPHQAAPGPRRDKQPLPKLTDAPGRPRKRSGVLRSISARF